MESKNMIKRVMKEIDKENENRIKNHGKIWSLEKSYVDLEIFFSEIIQFFELDKNIKDELDYDYSHRLEYKRQKHKYFSYIPYLLREIKPYLLLAYKLSQVKDIDDKFKNREIKEDSIVNMIENFIRLKRTGRNRKISESFLKDFRIFKRENQNLVEYYKEIETFDGIKTGSMRDYAHTIKKHNLSKEKLSKFINIWRYYRGIIRGCSRATLYRYDKDFILFKKMYYDVKHAYEKFDFYQKILNS